MSRFQTVSCPVKSLEEWGRVSPYMSWRALSLLPQKLPCNLDSKWSPGWLSAKTNYFLLHTCPSSSLLGFYFTLLSSIYHLKLEFVTFLISHPSSFTWGLFARCVFFFVWTVQTCVCLTFDFSQYYKQMYVTVLRKCDVCGSKRERLFLFFFFISVEADRMCHKLVFLTNSMDEDRSCRRDDFTHKSCSWNSKCHITASSDSNPRCRASHL